MWLREVIHWVLIVRVIVHGSLQSSKLHGWSAKFTNNFIKRKNIPAAEEGPCCNAAAEGDIAGLSLQVVRVKELEIHVTSLDSC